MLNCFSCFCEGWKFIKQFIALYLWQSVDRIVIDNGEAKFVVIGRGTCRYLSVC